MRDRRRRPRGPGRLCNPQTSGAHSRRNRRVRNGRRPRGPVARTGGCHPPAPHALRERRPLRATLVPRPRGPRVAPGQEPAPARRELARPLSPDRRGVPRARRGGSSGKRLGRELPPLPREADQRRRRRLRARRFRAASATSSSRPAIPGSRFLRSSRETHVRSTPTSRTSTPSVWRSSARAWPPRPSG